MNTVHIEIKVDAETKQRVEAAAAERNVSVNEYLLSAVQRQLSDDGVGTMLVTQDEQMQMAMKLRALRESILATRQGELIDVDALLDAVRNEKILLN